MLSLADQCAVCAAGYAYQGNALAEMFDGLRAFRGIGEGVGLVFVAKEYIDSVVDQLSKAILKRSDHERIAER